MDELIRQVLNTLRGMWQSRWLASAVAWLVGGIGVAVVLSLPDKYEASARVYVDTQSVLRPLMSGLAVAPDLEQQVAILSRTLISRPNVEKLIRMAYLDLKIKTKEERERLIDDLIGELKIGTTGRDNLYMILYRDNTPDRSQRVVQSLMTIFVESGLGDKRKDTDQARKFIEEQIKIYEKKLADAEARLKEFKLKNLTMSGDMQDKGYLGNLSELLGKLNQAKLELREAENSREALKRQIAGEEPVLLPENPGDIGQVAIPEIDQRIDAMKRNLDGLMQKYTDEHPDVVGTKRVIEQLEAQKRKEIQALKKSPGGAKATQLNANPIYQQLKLNLAEAETNIASLKVRVAEYESRYQNMRNYSKLAPEVEAEFAQLNRDYEVHKNNYQQLVTRRESASMGGELESTGGIAEFRVIDPPRVNPKPVAPNRMMLLGVVLVISLGAGVFVSLLTSQLRPTIFDVRTLRDVSGLPVLGNVSMLASEARNARNRRGLIGFLVSLGGLIAAFAGAFAFLLLTARA